MRFGLSHDDVKVAVYRIVEKSRRSHPFHNEMAGRAWLDGFMKRHPNLTLRTSQPLPYNPAVCANLCTINDYFVKLGVIYARLKILTKSMQVNNKDECGITIIHNPGKVVIELGRKKCVVSYIGREGKNSHTITLCECIRPSLASIYDLTS